MKNIVIVGAGISGLVLASFLKQHGNYKISIFEKKKNENKNDINGIQISPNAINILKKLNFDNFDNSKFYPIKSLNFYDCISKKKISVMNFNYLEKNSYIAINRTDLNNFLINEFDLKNHIFEKEVININSKSIFLKDGTKIDFDILVLADGIFSRLRSNKIKPLYSGYCAFRGSFFTEKQKSNIDLWMGKGFHLVTYPIDQNKINSFTFIKRIPEIRDITDYDFEADNFEMNFKKNLPEKAYDIFNSTNIKLWPIYKLNKIYYGDDKKIFIGDSAHGFIPSRAQGAAQAIEDSFILYNLITQNKLSNSQLLKIRESRVAKIIKKSESNLFIFHLSFFLLRLLRNLFIKIVCSSRILTKILNRYIFDYIFKKKL